jgi:two-component system, chemotaxis family, sensor kinase Cph1
MTVDVDLTACDREPIHVPGSIQPHGVMLVADPETLTVTHAAGDLEALGWGAWHGVPLGTLIGQSAVETTRRSAAGGTHFIGQIQAPTGMLLDATAHPSSGRQIVELEPAPAKPLPATALLAAIEVAATALEQSNGMQMLCERAAIAFRGFTGYDRVTVYQFLDDGAGVVVAEARRADLHSFLNHHFPSSDIPRQARELYVRNPVRVIPDVNYRPAVLGPDWSGAPLDMSDCVLRSVSPVHLQYLRNMDVRASASISVLKDGVLWGLIACHHQQPQPVPYEVRAACRVLAGVLSRQIKAREEADGYRERIRLRGFEDRLVSLLSREGTLDAALAHHLDEVRRSLNGDGVAVLRGQDFVASGVCPAEADVRALADWVVQHHAGTVLGTDHLDDIYPPASAFQNLGSGLLAITLSSTEPWAVLWFRAEQVEVIKWAGNPHKDASSEPLAALTPRASFEAWTETVRGRGRRWTLAEIEAAGRLRDALLDVRRHRQLQELNTRLLEALKEKDLLLAQKQFLIGEVNHRVQNSLQVVSSFLGLQARASSHQPELLAALEEARRRLSAVALVHRRLYRGDELGVVDAGRYLEELLSELLGSMDPAWSANLALDVAPVIVPADRAVPLGLVLTELVINANKYAYGGNPGPLQVRLLEDRANFRLVVADSGKGKATAKGGFGSRVIDAMVAQLQGEIAYEDNSPGLRVTVSAPVSTPSAARPQ